MVDHEVTDIASRLELLADEHLIDRLVGGAAQRLHHPAPAEVALVFDRPWEGNGCNYLTVFRDGLVCRLYYRGAHGTYLPDGCEGRHEVTCYAESSDGITWHRPDLSIFEVMGTRHNNVILTGEVGGAATHNFSPFRDPRTDIPDSEKYKALGGSCTKWGGQDLLAFGSPDGIHWTRLAEKGVITQGAFDSQNVSFWDGQRKEYRAYVRDFRQGRDIRTCTSKDFRTWTDAEFLEYTPGRISELYTNQVQPYYRAPHLLLGFPTRYVQRPWQAATDYLPQPERRRLRAMRSVREGSAVTDSMFMLSRDGRQFRVWPESFIRPGLHDREGWFYGDNYQALGLIETASRIEGAPRELSLFATEATSQAGAARLRRYTIRVDGFVSVNAPLSGGELVTRPLRFKGMKLLMNYATGAAGSVRVEIQDADGAPLPGYGLADAEEMFGDSLEQPVLWKHGADVSRLAGQPVRLRFVLADADLYSYRFC
jgi:hypothetical protein